MRMQGVYEIDTEPFRDHRGTFIRSYDEGQFSSAGVHRRWVQENQSISNVRGTIRGLHFQYSPNTETKLIRVITGAILDVFVDLRTGSPTFGQWDSIELSENNWKMLYLPRGFAHGFCTLTDNCTVAYKVDAEYNRSADGGIRWNDPELNIPWPATKPVLSDKDCKLPTLAEYVAGERRVDKA